MKSVSNFKRFFVWQFFVCLFDYITCYIFNATNTFQIFDINKVPKDTQLTLGMNNIRIRKMSIKIKKSLSLV